MRTLAAIGAFLVGAVLIGLLMAPVASAGNLPAPALQTTVTATADAATAVATAEATAAATAAATTTAATATVAPGTLPNTGGESGLGGLWLAGVALLITGLALAVMFAGRRSTNSM